MKNMPAPHDFNIIAFDVFGTVVDWHGSVSAEVQSLYPQVDGDAFARAWRAGYGPAMARVASGELAWCRLEVLHRMILDGLLPTYGLGHLDEAARVHLNHVWQRLRPWPDTVAALHRLKARFTICTLSNGNLSLLTRMAKHAGLPWDCILSAEVFRAYKPDPATYGGVAEVFGVEPRQVLMVATHQDDLDAARRCSLLTAYVERPLEFGQRIPKEANSANVNDLHARDLLHLADQLGC